MVNSSTVAATNQQNNGYLDGACKGILWSCIARDDIIIVEAGEDPTPEKVVTKSAQGILARKATAGWEYGRCRCRGKNNGRQIFLRSMKFHVYQKDPWSSNHKLNIWVFACVYEKKSVAMDQAKSFLEKMVVLTELSRENDPIWQYGSTLAAQESFAPILQQRMQEVSYMGRLAMVHERVVGDSVSKEVMQSNMELMFENQERTAELLREEVSAMESKARLLKRKAATTHQGAKRFHAWQNAKHGVIMGSVLVCSVVIVTVPPLIALL